MNKLSYLFKRPFSSTQSSLNNMVRHQLPAALEARRPSQSPEQDFSTLSNYIQFTANHTTLNVVLDFKQKVIMGTVQFNLVTKTAIEKIILDSSFIRVNSIVVNGESKQFSIADRIEPLGCALTIEHTAPQDTPLELLLDFSTTSESTAVQWLKNGDGPDSSDYVFTQLEPIHARALFPCFDTPAIKTTFSAKITSPHPVVFSGLPSTTTQKNSYAYEQKVPIPSYLVAIASGNFKPVPIGPRSTLYAEPHLLGAARAEFADDMERFILAAESVAGPYIWTTYDFLVNPASFPYGGMENPNITFVTPTLISYDKSQVDVIAHELAHSWAGNNVTNCSWEHFYLNEGWTVYLERRISSALPDGSVDEKSRHFQYIQGWGDLVGAIESLPKFEYSRLVQDLKKGTIDPDDTFSSVPYEKGANLIFQLEHALGGITEFDPFIKYYFSKFSKQSIDTYQFIDALYEFYSNDAAKIQILNDWDWTLWLYTPGLPPQFPFDTTLVDQVSALASLWISKAEEFTTVDQFTSFFGQGSHHETYTALSSPQRILLLDLLLETPSATWSSHAIVIDALITTYPDLQSSRNTEIISRFYKLKLSARKTEFYQDLSDWLGTIGRMKYVRPGFRQLNEVDHKLAIETFQKFRGVYHPICAAMVKKDLGL